MYSNKKYTVNKMNKVFTLNIKHCKKTHRIKTTVMKLLKTHFKTAQVQGRFRRSCTVFQLSWKCPTSGGCGTVNNLPSSCALTSGKAPFEDCKGPFCRDSPEWAPPRRCRKLMTRRWKSAPSSRTTRKRNFQEILYLALLLKLIVFVKCLQSKYWKI